MCAFCTVVAGEPHWTETGTDAARGNATPTGNARVVARARRLALVNRILAHYGCTADDWAGGQYLVHSRRGRTELAERLPQIWTAVDSIAARPVDPLDPDLLAALGAPRP